ncbi:hypothetical protein NQ176_g10041 [Zarea fungicola]|uniref:Uncharacterized protein n=1 Tax=Zarea fungicola TaxID=93591 RepID=A0ACC1MJ24_9HYPO|nr:hypothetical protein NQ176_g10041 [Lecanicillium fungicola]
MYLLLSSLPRRMQESTIRAPAGSARNTGAAGKPTALADITNVAADINDDQDDEPRQEFQRDFSPDYEPSPNARIRTVTKDSENTRDAARARKATSPRAANSKPATKTFLDLDGGSDDEQASRYRAGGYKPGSSSRNDTSNDDTLRAGKKLSRTTDQPSPGPNRSRSNLRLPSDGNRSVSGGTMSTETDYKSAPSGPPSVRVEDSDEPGSAQAIGKDLEAMQAKGLDEPLFIIGEPTEDDKLKAKKIYDGLEDFIQKDKAAAWMGEEGPIRKRTLQAYMELYNFTDKSIVSALRSICERLILRAETQQVDRILVAFSKRWCDCNPNHGFKATDIIHTICYSIMLLNTDLHVADIEQKMTRSQFVKNTLSTIRQALLESKPDAFQRPSILPDKSPMLALDSQTGEPDRSTIRNSFRPPPKPETQGPEEDCGPLVKNSWNVPLRAWEELVEQVLKSIYNSIRDDRLPLFGAEDRSLGAAPSQSNLSVMGMLKRTPSVLSKAPSEGQGSTRGRIADGGRSNASRWTSKSRSRPGLGRNGMASSRTSFDDDNSLWSPAMSSATWSRYSLGRTQASMSQDSFASSMPRGDYQQSIGFANALSQSIIRDEDLNGNETAPSIMSSDFMSTQLLEDESLELAGPPWVKEGMVVHKHHLDGLGKRAKDRNWSEVFAVVQKGQLSLFSFSLSKSARQKGRPRTTGRVTAPVGGGNWQDNAVNVGTFNLRLTLASALPSPGYSRSRPYVWALSLPTGAVHLFQVGTPEIIREFVNSANYWSARLSTHPLVGGISNIEYGWSDSIVNNALVSAIHGESSPPPTGTPTQPPQSGHTRKSSAQSIAISMKSLSFDHGSGVSFTHSSRGGKLPGDRVHIAPWAPPTQSVRPSNFSEAEQLEALEAYVRSIEGDLQSHNQLRSPMLLAFTPRGQNAAKAMANWERKSSYLLREIVKFRTYVDCLHQAETRRCEVYKERDLALRAARGDLSDTESDGSVGRGDADEGNETLRPE